MVHRYPQIQSKNFKFNSEAISPFIFLYGSYKAYDHSPQQVMLCFRTNPSFDRRV